MFCLPDRIGIPASKARSCDIQCVGLLTETSPVTSCAVSHACSKTSASRTPSTQSRRLGSRNTHSAIDFGPHLSFSPRGRLQPVLPVSCCQGCSLPSTSLSPTSLPRTATYGSPIRHSLPSSDSYTHYPVCNLVTYLMYVHDAGQKKHVVKP